MASLVFFRVAFGVVMLAAVGRYFAYGWIDSLFVRPRFFFAYPGFEWVQPWPAWGMYLHFAALGVLAAAIVVGCFTRTALAAFALAFTWVHLLDKTIYLNHYYLVSVLAAVMSLLPMGAAGSVDAWRAPERAAARVPAWVVWVLRIQLALVYFYGGVAKLNADWLVHGQPLRIWLAARGDLPLLGPWLELPWMAYAFSWAGAAFDLGIAPFLFWRRTRLLAYGVVVVFHVLTSLLFPIGIFPWLMIGLTPIFLDPGWPRRVHAVARAAGLPAMARAARAAGASAGRVAVVRGERAIVAALALHLALQATIPLRTFVATDDVAWTEEGFRFAWRVMAMEKAGTTTFRLRDPATGLSWKVDPRAELTPLQASMMATQPDMIADYARHLAAEARRAGRGDVEVRADAWVSLNGRPSRRFVDPEADLAREARAPILPRPGD
ncbi:MAG: HTTM domain-containing protein [Deltaproteobacteria bacterium]|nr:HTTM domain-containing protein [Deltaproteobacteria bacterium]